MFTLTLTCKPSTKVPIYICHIVDHEAICHHRKTTKLNIIDNLFLTNFPLSSIYSSNISLCQDDYYHGQIFFLAT